MDEPLTKWYCDVCGEVIEDAGKGYVIWEQSSNMKDHGFKIIHQTKCDLREYRSSFALGDFIGSDGLAYLLTFLSPGVIKRRLGEKPHCYIEDMDEFVDFVRQVQTPYYEEARRLFGNSDLLEDHDDDNQLGPYTQSSLRTIIKKYRV